ncbi:MAG: YIP1 family protein, partial [Candidatus Methanospirareceae archaeon]
FGGRKGLKQTVKAVMYGATPCLVLGWLPGPNILIAPIWSLFVMLCGIMELQEIYSGKAILAVILAILIPVIIIVAILSKFIPMVF